MLQSNVAMNDFCLYTQLVGGNKAKERETSIDKVLKCVNLDIVIKQ